MILTFSIDGKSDIRMHRIDIIMKQRSMRRIFKKYECIIDISVVYRKRVSSTFFHIFTHFSTFFHIFPSPSLHFPNSCHKLNYSKEKVNPQDTFDGHLILNLKQFNSESSKKAVPQNIFPKLLYPQNILQKLL